MSPEDMERIRRSFAKVAMLNGQFGTQFYDCLFGLDPSLRPLFGDDIGPQGQQLVNTLGAAVRHLSNPTVLVESLKAMGERHRGYGVLDDHYGTVRTALLSALEVNLGPEFTPEVRQSWQALFDLVAGMMRVA